MSQPLIEGQGRAIFGSSTLKTGLKCQRESQPAMNLFQCAKKLNINVTTHQADKCLQQHAYSHNKLENGRQYCQALSSM